MKSVLLIRTNSFSTRVLKEANSLKDAGYSVNILCWDRNNSNSKYNVNSGININYFKFKAPFGKVTLIPLLFAWWVYEFRHMLKNDYDIIHACGFDSLFPAILIKAVKKNKLVYDIFDFYSESLPKGIPTKITYLIAALEKYCIKFADHVIIVDESRYVQIQGSKIKNISVIMNCTYDIISDLSVLPTYNKCKFTVLYAGMISKTRGLEQLIQSIENEKDMNLIVAGIGEDENYFKPMFSKMKNVDYKGRIPHKEALYLTYHANVIFGFYDPVIPNNRLASPNKLFDAMMCGTPIIINEETSMKKIVSNNKCGIIVPYNNVDLLKKALIEIKDNPHIAKEMGLNGRKAFEKEYNWNIMEKRLISLYDTLSALDAD